MPKTGREIKMLAYRRNAVLGQLHMARTSFSNAIARGLVSKVDGVLLKTAIGILDIIINSWDKHYISKLVENELLDETLENVRTLGGASL